MKPAMVEITGLGLTYRRQYLTVGKTSNGEEEDSKDYELMNESNLEEPRPSIRASLPCV